MTDTPTPNADRDSHGRFLPGHAGGRPPGARNRISRKLLLELHRDFEVHKAELLQRLRSTYTPSYFNTLARMMPQMAQTEAAGFEDYSHAQAERLVSRLKRALAVNADPHAALAELDLVLALEPADGSGDGRDGRED